MTLSEQSSQGKTLAVLVADGYAVRCIANCLLRRQHPATDQGMGIVIDFRRVKNDTIRGIGSDARNVGISRIRTTPIFWRIGGQRNRGCNK
uniref:PPM-type phosphatase domain-containing protein n=1 Tax=Panagrellus redivivus TaxID=6233 RepID=A0A7E4WA05_PANRE